MLKLVTDSNGTSSQVKEGFFTILASLLAITPAEDKEGVMRTRESQSLEESIGTVLSPILIYSYQMSR